MKSIHFPPKNFSSSLHSCLTRLRCINFIHTHWSGNIKTAKFEEGILFISHMFTFRRYIFSHTLPILVSVDDDLFWKNIRTKFTSLIIYHIDRVYFLWKISTHFDIRSLITILDYLNDLWHKCWIRKYFQKLDVLGFRIQMLKQTLGAYIAFKKSNWCPK